MDNHSFPLFRIIELRSLPPNAGRYKLQCSLLKHPKIERGVLERTSPANCDRGFAQNGNPHWRPRRAQSLSTPEETLRSEDPALT
ncbi:hypothetical protein KPH14_002494 [Odynerus spinipes]|uniref:Uncharacterized protein n=1 Tax=Odynerus spinipes TaxID=1348599 RepID=A0AAD9VS11_9HYME|nr:hypothetical protein KPH14_002494 [Odynerus spinipes]